MHIAISLVLIIPSVIDFNSGLAQKLRHNQHDFVCAVNARKTIIFHNHLND